MTPGRFHLLLTVAGRPAMHGWWNDETTARRMVAAWVGERGQSGARITLTDEMTGETLMEWPKAG